LAYDATVKAEVDTRLMEALAEANQLQVHRLVKRQQALRAGDPVLAKPSTSTYGCRRRSQSMRSTKGTGSGAPSTSRDSSKTVMTR
jgi:hypothetical protein